MLVFRVVIKNNGAYGFDEYSPETMTKKYKRPLRTRNWPKPICC